MADASPVETKVPARLARSPASLPASVLCDALQLAVPGRDIDTSHFFAPGMYCRVVKRKAGVTIIGKQHKAAHFYIVCKGSVQVYAPDGSHRVVHAGEVIVSQPGTQRAVVALEDAVCLTVHRTDKTDVEEIERELIEPSPHALFDAHNRIKQEALE